MDQRIFRLPEPLKCTGNLETNWKKFIRAFNNYMKASCSTEKQDEIKVAILLNIIGGEAQDIYESFNLSEEDKEIYDVVIDEFEKYCIPRTSILHERNCFYQRNQQDGETFDQFMTDVIKLVKSCEFGAHENAAIRDRLVFGTADKIDQERLIKLNDPSLEEIVESLRVSERKKTQANVIKKENSDDFSKSSLSKNQKYGNSKRNKRKGNSDYTQDLLPHFEKIMTQANIIEKANSDVDFSKSNSSKNQKYGNRKRNKLKDNFNKVENGSKDSLMKNINIKSSLKKINYANNNIKNTDVYEVTATNQINMQMKKICSVETVPRTKAKLKTQYIQKILSCQPVVLLDKISVQKEILSRQPVVLLDKMSCQQATIDDSLQSNLNLSSSGYLRNMNGSNLNLNNSINGASATGLMPLDGRRRKTSTNSNGRTQGSPYMLMAGNREVNNEIARDYWAYLKECFEQLKVQLQLTDEEKKTNLAILGAAFRLVKTLKIKEHELVQQVEQLAKENINAKKKINSLKRELSAKYDNVNFAAIIGDFNSIPEHDTLNDPPFISLGRERCNSSTLSFNTGNIMSSPLTADIPVQILMSPVMSDSLPNSITTVNQTIPIVTTVPLSLTSEKYNMQCRSPTSSNPLTPSPSSEILSTSPSMMPSSSSSSPMALKVPFNNNLNNLQVISTCSNDLPSNVSVIVMKDKELDGLQVTSTCSNDLLSNVSVIVMKDKELNGLQKTSTCSNDLQSNVSVIVRKDKQ